MYYYLQYLFQCLNDIYLYVYTTVHQVYIIIPYTCLKEIYKNKAYKKYFYLLLKTYN